MNFEIMMALFMSRECDVTLTLLTLLNSTYNLKSLSRDITRRP